MGGTVTPVATIRRYYNRMRNESNLSVKNYCADYVSVI